MTQREMGKNKMSPFPCNHDILRTRDQTALEACHDKYCCRRLCFQVIFEHLLILLLVRIAVTGHYSFICLDLLCLYVYCNQEIRVQTDSSVIVILIKNRHHCTRDKHISSLCTMQMSTDVSTYCSRCTLTGQNSESVPRLLSLELVPYLILNSGCRNP